MKPREFMCETELMIFTSGSHNSRIAFQDGCYMALADACNREYNEECHFDSCCRCYFYLRSKRSEHPTRDDSLCHQRQLLLVTCLLCPIGLEHFASRLMV